MTDDGHDYYCRPDEPRTWGVKLLYEGQDLWWKDWGRGYTTEASRAGLFSERFALQQARRADDDRRDVAVSADEMRRMFEEIRDSAQERLTQWRSP